MVGRPLQKEERIQESLLSELGWLDSTWSARASQVAKWLHFCGEEIPNPFPDSEHYVLAYIGYLLLEGSVNATSLPQYISAVSQYHELHHKDTPMKKALLWELVRVYIWHTEIARVGPVSIRIGFPEELIQKSFDLGRMRHNWLRKTILLCKYVQFRRKGRISRRPLVIQYARAPSWLASNPITLTCSWHQANAMQIYRFTMSLHDSLQHVLFLLCDARVDIPLFRPQSEHRRHQNVPGPQLQQIMDNQTPLLEGWGYAKGLMWQLYRCLQPFTLLLCSSFMIRPPTNYFGFFSFRFVQNPFYAYEDHGRVARFLQAVSYPSV